MYPRMDGKLAIEIIFVVSGAAMLALILRRPYLYIRMGSRQVRLATYFLGALIGPALLLALGVLHYSQLLAGLQGYGEINPVSVLVLFLSLVFLSIFLDITGFFEYCARLALNLAGSSGRGLFFSLYITVSFLTIFTSNDIVILTFTPFIYYVSRQAGIDPLPYLVAEFFAANTWSMMLYIGNPTNILLASSFRLGFAPYFFRMALPTVAAGTVNLLLLYLLFRHRINRPLTPSHMPAASALTDRPGATLGVVLLAGCLIALSLAPTLDVDMWMISVGFALSLMLVLLVRDVLAAARGRFRGPFRLTTASALRRVPWGIVPFVLGMFIMVETLRVYGVTADLGALLSRISGDSAAAHVFAYGFSSAFSANLINNIPMSVAYVPMVGAVSAAHLHPALYATIAGSNLGANLTPLGALAGIMWMSMLTDRQAAVSFREFVGYGLLVTPVTLTVCLATLALTWTFL